jgi:Flp pilus assembly protein TadG
MLTRRFLKEKKGLAAIEFALIGPVLATLLMGTIELCNALGAHQKVTTLASSAADLVAQTTSVSANDMTDIFSAVSAIMYPYPTTSVKITISSIVSDGNGNGTVAWSQTKNGTALSVNSAVAVPVGLMDKSVCAKGACSIILATISYPYSSPVSKFFTSTVNMGDYFYARPRKSATIAYTG